MTSHYFLDLMHVGASELAELCFKSLKIAYHPYDTLIIVRTGAHLSMTVTS